MWALLYGLRRYGFVKLFNQIVLELVHLGSLIPCYWRVSWRMMKIFLKKNIPQLIDGTHNAGYFLIDSVSIPFGTTELTLEKKERGCVAEGLWTAISYKLFYEDFRISWM